MSPHDYATINREHCTSESIGYHATKASSLGVRNSIHQAVTWPSGPGHVQ